MVEKGLKRIRLLNRLTLTKWGATQDILITTYKTYVRPVMEYGNEVIITASKTSLKKLDRVQNLALRTITGAANGNAAMEAQTNIELLDVRREKAALKFWERNKRVYTSYWKGYKQAGNRLHNQRTPLALTTDLIAKLNLHLGEPAPLPIAPGLVNNLPVASLTLEEHSIPKHASLDIEL
jgi:hypothetical protein